MKLIKRIITLSILLAFSIFVFACNKPKTFTINWIVEGETVETDIVNKGETPTFDGSTPIKANQNGYAYTFSKWSPEVVAATSNQDYVATFIEKALPLPSDVDFKSQKFTYDGNVHLLEVENLPEGATVKYTNNGRTEPGNQDVKATITYNGKDYKYSATLTILKNDSVLTMEPVQTIESGSVPEFSIDNEEQTLKFDIIYAPGVYFVDCYALNSEHYNESNHVKVKLTVVDKTVSGISFSSTTMIADGTPKSLLATNVPEGYSVIYENNTLTNPGRTYAICKIYDSNNQLVDSLKAIFTLEYQENEQFKDFLNEFLLAYLGDDYFAWNVYSADPEALGFDRSEYDDAEWYSYEKIDEAFREEALQEFVDLNNELKAFENAELSNNQRIAYNKIKEFIEPYLSYYAVDGDYLNSLENLNYIDQFGGYPSDFATSIEGYIYRSENDVKDVLSYIKSTATVYPTYINYAKDRIEAGFPLSDFTLNEMIDFLSDIVEQGENYYLGSFVKEKINGLEFLDEASKTSYCATVDEYFATYFIPANENLITGLTECLGHIVSINDEGYWAKYENGATLFEDSLRDNIGNQELSLNDYSSYIDGKMRTYVSKINDIIKDYRKMGASQADKWYSYISGSPIIGISDPNEMIVYLKEFAKTIVPELESDPQVLIKYMDTTAAEKSNAVAYYMRSAIDSFTDEYITLNPLKTSTDVNDTLSTVAHEGYPGHLYAHVFSKDSDYANILKVMSSTAYSEGWATYVQLKLYDYMKEHLTGTSSTKETMSLAIDYLYYNQLVGYLLYNKIDYMIHVEHSKISDIAKYMDDMGFNGGAAEEIYRTLIEMPTGYNSYGYGMVFMNDLHIDCKARLGSLYNEVDFNKFVLSTTQTSLYELKSLTDQYIEDTLFLYGE